MQKVLFTILTLPAVVLAIFARLSARRMKGHLGCIKMASPTGNYWRQTIANNAYLWFSIIENETKMRKRRVIEAIYIRDMAQF